MIIIYLLILIFIILSLKYRKFRNPYKLYMVFGKKGSGKSSYLAKLAMEYSKRNYLVYTNMFDLDVFGIRYIEPKQIGEFVPEPHSVILLDEVGMLYDNRNYKEFRPQTRDFFKLQRHYKCIVYLASQSFDIDKKLRDLTDEMYLISNVTSFLSLIRPITKKITLTEASSLGESKIADNLKFRWIFSWKLIFVPKYAKYFQSFLLPDHEFLPYKENNTTAKNKNALVKLNNIFRLKSRKNASEASREKF